MADEFDLEFSAPNAAQGDDLFVDEQESQSQQPSKQGRPSFELSIPNKGATVPDSEDVLVLLNGNGNDPDAIEEQQAGTKRRYESVLDPNIQSLVKSRKQDLELQTRIYFLLHLHVNDADALVQYNFGDVTGAGARDVLKWARERVFSNARNWKKRAKDNLKLHVIEMMEKDEDLKQDDNIVVIHRYFEKTYSGENFVKVFDFADKWLDVEGSGDAVKEWCTMIYVELATSMKRHLDWKLETNRLAVSEVDDEWFHTRMRQICDTKTFQEVKPDAREIKRVTRCMKTAKSKSSKRPLPDLDADVTLYRGKRSKRKQTGPAPEN